MIRSGTSGFTLLELLVAITIMVIVMGSLVVLLSLALWGKLWGVIGMFLCVQALTCPGASFLHSASLSARIPTVAAIEGNGRQYCPAGNAGYRNRFPGGLPAVPGTLLHQMS